MSLLQDDHTSEKALLVGIRHPRQGLIDFQESLLELERLAHTAGAYVIGTLYQDLKKIDSATYIGHGKMEELAGKVLEFHADLVIFDEDFSPRQNRNLEETLKCKVLDRTGLILDIFAQHAKSKEGKLQVELAQSIYLMPRLVGRWQHFGRLGGGIGTRGPGETQLEVDRRRVRERVGQIRKELRRVEKSRDLHRHRREGVPIPTVAMVGYTNAGKSTLMNCLTEAHVLVEDKLFATLDPKVRKLQLPSGQRALLSDTVGFIRKLPHSLVEAFKATFEEVRAADLLLHVIDRSHPSWEQQMQVVESVLAELKLSQKPRINVYNKVDLLGSTLIEDDGAFCISARENIGVAALLTAIEQKLQEDYKTLSLVIPYRESARLDWLYRVGKVESRKDDESGVHMEVSLSPPDIGRLKKEKNIRICVG